jgi:two-component system phosphate regulon sensor histidine kinase PhoR
VFGDYQRLVQTFGNLISSAVHFSPPGGRVQVRLFTRSNGRGSWAVIQVQDGGPGIPPDQLAFVFDPFFRASEGDASTTGLELTVARHIVELHRGLLTVESDAQVGNTFTLQLSTNLTPLPSER